MEDQNAHPKNAVKWNWLLVVLSVAIALVQILVAFYQWLIAAWLTVFLMPLVMQSLTVALVTISGWSMVHLVLNYRLIGFRAASPLSINVVTGLILWFVPFTSLYLDFNFHAKHDRRMYVVERILSGDLVAKPERMFSQGSSVLTLPTGYGDLSTGRDDVLIQRRDGTVLVMFITFSGILDNFSGFVYSSDGKPPREDDFIADFREILPVEGNWYWAVSW